MEEVLGAALALNSSKAHAHHTSSSTQNKKNESVEIEAHLEALLVNFDDKENEEFEARRARLASAQCDKSSERERKALREDSGLAYVGSTPEKCKGRRRTQISDSHGDNENSIMRKGTGFIYVAPNEYHARINDHHGDNENSIVRKGTGYIHLNDSMPQGKRVRIDDPHGDNENKLVRVATGHLKLSSLPKMEPAPWFPDISGGVNRIQRKGTGYIDLAQASRKVNIVDDHGDNENGIQRKGTGFVHLSGLPHEEEDTDFTIYEDSLDALTAAA